MGRGALKDLSASALGGPGRVGVWNGGGKMNREIILILDNFLSYCLLVGLQFNIKQTFVKLG